MKTPFEDFLNRHDEAAWARTLSELLPSIHEVDRAATQIWFYFFPLALQRTFERSDDPEKLAQELLMMGAYHLKDHIDSSHTFLYGHRFWPEVKQSIIKLADSENSTRDAPLAERIREAATQIAAARKTDLSLVVGITAVAFMTLQQVGLEAFRQSPGAVLIDKKHAGKSPEQILRERARDDSQGILGFLRTTDKQWSVVWDENKDDRRFRAVHLQEVASAAATDKRDWSAVDPRCTIDEGPIPVQCRSASCGTCWVGVLGGAEKLTDVSARESRMMKQFGYIDTDEAKPLIRLACQAQTTGAVSIVIPPWNGFFGKYLKREKEVGSLKSEV
jgi:ferredoxin